MLLVYKDEIAKANAILQKKFKRIDENNTGFISTWELRKAMMQTNLITPKEINKMMMEFQS